MLTVTIIRTLFSLTARTELGTAYTEISGHTPKVTDTITFTESQTDEHVRSTNNIASYPTTYDSLTNANAVTSITLETNQPHERTSLNYGTFTSEKLSDTTFRTDVQTTFMQRTSASETSETSSFTSVGTTQRPITTTGNPDATTNGRTTNAITAMSTNQPPISTNGPEGPTTMSEPTPPASKTTYKLPTTLGDLTTSAPTTKKITTPLDRITTRSLIVTTKGPDTRTSKPPRTTLGDTTKAIVTTPAMPDGTTIAKTPEQPIKTTGIIVDRTTVAITTTQPIKTTDIPDGTTVETTTEQPIKTTDIVDRTTVAITTTQPIKTNNIADGTTVAHITKSATTTPDVGVVTTVNTTAIRPQQTTTHAKTTSARQPVTTQGRVPETTQTIRQQSSEPSYHPIFGQIFDFEIFNHFDSGHSVQHIVKFSVSNLV